METGLVTVTAAALAGDINRTGHASVYGIYFRIGKADIKPEPEPPLTEVARLLSENPDLKLYVVGQTDNFGNRGVNMDFSCRGAQAVVQALTAKNGVASARLESDGIGPLSAGLERH